MNLVVWNVRNLRHRLRGWKQELMAMFGIGIGAELSIKLIRGDGTEVDFGLVSRRKVTTAAAAFIIDAFQNLAELESMNWHDSGTGVTAEANSQTTLVTPSGVARVAGTQSEPSAQVYRTVATISYSSTLAITEHAVFSASSGGVMLDRSVFSAVNVVSGDSIQFTYDLTANAEA